MAKRLSKKSAKKPAVQPAKKPATEKPAEKPPKLHKSFKRSYREDYVRPFEAPGLISHAVTSFKTVLKNWRLFLPLILLLAILNIAFVGLMNEDTFVQFQKALDDTTEGIQTGQIGSLGRSGLLLISTITTGGLSAGMTESQQVFAILLFMIGWLVTIYILRQRLAKNRIKLRDALYNALSPLLSTLVVAAIIFIEAIPAMIVVIAYSAAVRTDFLSTPFYALIFFIFAALLILLSVYLISSSLLALVAVTAPGLYPLTAVRTAADLLVSRRIKFIIRIIYLFFVLGLLWAVIMLPLISLDLWLKPIFDWLAGIPFVSIELLLMTCFSVVYASTYLYLFYRRLLDYED